MTVSAIAINCTLVRTRARKSSTDAMIGVLGEAFAAHDVRVTDTIRIAASARMKARVMTGPQSAPGFSRMIS